MADAPTTDHHDPVVALQQAAQRLIERIDEMNDSVLKSTNALDATNEMLCRIVCWKPSGELRIDATPKSDGGFLVTVALN